MMKPISQRSGSITLAASLALLFIGERFGVGLVEFLVLGFVGEDTELPWLRWVLSGLGAALFAVAIAMLVRHWQRSEGARRQAARAMLLHAALCAVGLGIYVAQLEELGALEGQTRAILQVLAGAALLGGLLPIAAIEISLRSAGDSPHLEPWRINLAVRSARIVFFSIVVFAGLNFAASRWNRKIDLSYFATTQVGDANRALVEGLDAPLDIYLFFAPGNEVLEHVKAYMDELALAGPKVKVHAADQALDPELARSLKVRANGYIALRRGPDSETIRLGLDLEAATATLRKLDSEMHERLMKMLRPDRVAYLTTGHLERDHSPPSDDKRRGFGDFRQVLDTLGFTVRRLGLGDGLGSKIPDDATVVIVPGPLEPFLPAEVQALHAYLDEGGKVLFAMDPDQGITGDELLQPLGVQVSSALVATDNLRHLWRQEDQRDTPYNLVTNKTAAHGSSTTLNKMSARLYVLAAGSGRVVKRPDAASDLQVTMTLRSMPQSFLDENRNGVPDKEEERSTFDFAAAIERKSKGPLPARALVFADADLFGDMLVRNQGNVAVVMDAMRWLTGDEKLAGKVEDEKDVRISHRRDEDRVWFYGGSVLAPISILLLGLWISRRRGGQS